MLIDRAEPWQDVHGLAPFLLEVRAVELGALIDNHVFRSNTLLEHDPSQGCRYFFGRGLRLEYGESDQPRGIVMRKARSNNVSASVNRC